MLHIHHSNQLEKLAQGLIGSYKKNNLPLLPRIILTESKSLARWLEHQFCLQEGINCLVDTQLPATWLWKQTRAALDLPYSENPLSREQMQWRIHAALTNSDIATKANDGDTISRYLQEDNNGLKHWQLAGRIADCFDRYQYYRPELIRSWSKGKENHWQAHLWREISRDIDKHHVALMDDFIVATSHLTDTDKLPPRLDLFSIHNLPPLLLDACTAIAEHIPVNFWLLAPTLEYWADLASPREMASLLLKKPEDAVLWQAGNPLLTQWGRQGQVFQDMLLTKDLSPADDNEHFVEPERDSLLKHAQADIYEACESTTNHRSEDKTQLAGESEQLSIQVHICHSAMRECMVLQDTILHCLQKDENLQPEDILVMVPEISQYAPYIRAVFGSKRAITPFNLNDITIADEHPVTRAFLGLLDLPQSRFTRAEILNLLHIPEIQRQFNLRENDIPELTELFDRMRVYWGINDKDKDERLQLPAIDENTWHQGFQRLMAGFALGNEPLWNDIAPLSGITAQSGERAAHLFNLLQTLRKWSKQLDEPRSPADWAKTLSKLCDDIFRKTYTDADDARLMKIHETIAELEKYHWSSPAPLSLAVIRQWLHSQLESSSKGVGSFYSGGITFCGLKPLRGVPFKVICLMGMHEQAFPRRRTRMEFDLMANDWQHGDPNPALEDRYLFLETLLAARQHLIISYTGRDIRNNDKRPPSIVVQEMIDYIDERYQLPSSLITQHPLQPFNLGNYGVIEQECHEPPRPSSFDSWWLDIGKAVQTHQPPVKKENWPTPDIALPDSFQREVSVEELGAMLAKPIQKFIQKRLKLYNSEENSQSDSEPFALDNLQSWQIKDHLLQNSEIRALRQLRAEGMLPHGANGEICLADNRDKMEALLELIEPYQQSNATPLDIDLSIAIDSARTWQITGRIPHFHEAHGIIHITASAFKPENLLRLWVEHLCLQLMYEKGASSHLFSNDKTKMRKRYTLKSVETTMARNILKTLLGHFETSLHSPLPLPPSAAYEYAKILHLKNDENEAMKKAKKVFSESRDNYYTEFLLRHHQLDFDEDCRSLAEQVMTPLAEHLEEIK